MSIADQYTEDTLIEQPTIALFGDLGWETANLYNEWAAGKSSEGRETDHEAILVSRLRPALETLNPGLPSQAISQAVEELTRDRSKMLVSAAGVDGAE